MHLKPYWRQNGKALNDAVKEENKSYEKLCKSVKPRGDCILSTKMIRDYLDKNRELPKYNMRSK